LNQKAAHDNRLGPGQTKVKLADLNRARLSQGAISFSSGDRAPFAGLWTRPCRRRGVRCQ
jgi:hypothetical protein